MRPLLAAVLLLALAASPLRATEAPAEPQAARLAEQVHQDQNALRRARYAWHKAQRSGSGQEEAHQGWQEAKEKLKADRLKLKALRDAKRREASR